MYTLLSGPMVYTLFPLFSQENGIHHIFFCSVTSGSGNRPRKEGWHNGGVHSFFPWLRRGKTNLAQFRRGFEKGLLKDNFASLLSFPPKTLKMGTPD